MTGLSFIDGLAPINRPRGPPGLYPGAVLELYGPAGRSVIMLVINMISGKVSICPSAKGGLGTPLGCIATRNLTVAPFSA